MANDDPEFLEQYLAAKVTVGLLRDAQRALPYHRASKALERYDDGELARAIMAWRENKLRDPELATLLSTLRMAGKIV